jgi:hypothetical protein
MLRRFTSYAKPVILAILVYACIGVAIPRETHAWELQRVLPVPLLPQQKPNWCWVASARMVLMYKNGTAPSQCALVNWYHGTWDCSDWSGTVYQVASILRGHGLKQSEGFWGTLSMVDIRYQIDRYQPVIAAWSWSWTSGHMVVLRGYYSDNYGDTVYWLDPAPNSGGYGAGSYQWFVHQPNHHTWTYTVWKNTW